jgi:hypothetical protein
VKDEGNYVNSIAKHLANFLNKMRLFYRLVMQRTIGFTCRDTPTLTLRERNGVTRQATIELIRFARSRVMRSAPNATNPHQKTHRVSPIRVTKRSGVQRYRLRAKFATRLRLPVNVNV